MLATFSRKPQSPYLDKPEAARTRAPGVEAQAAVGTSSHQAPGGDDSRSYLGRGSPHPGGPPEGAADKHRNKVLRTQVLDSPDRNDLGHDGLRTMRRLLIHLSGHGIEMDSHC